MTTDPHTHGEDKGKANRTCVYPYAEPSQPLNNKAIFPVRDSDDGGGEGRRGGGPDAGSTHPLVADLQKHEGPMLGG